MPYVRDIAKMPQNIISPQALMTTGTLLAEKEGVSDGHQSPHHSSLHRHRHVHVLLYRLRSIPVSVSVSVSSPIRSFNFPIPQLFKFHTLMYLIPLTF